jgi:hypothetical protein
LYPGPEPDVGDDLEFKPEPEAEMVATEVEEKDPEITEPWLYQ